MVQGRIHFKMNTAQAARRPPTRCHSCKACVYACAHVLRGCMAMCCSRPLVGG